MGVRAGILDFVVAIGVFLGYDFGVVFFSSFFLRGKGAGFY